MRLPRRRITSRFSRPATPAVERRRVAAHLRRIAIGPRAFHQRPPGVAVAGLGDAALAAPRPRRVLRGRETEIAHQLARAVKAREVPELGQQDDRARELNPSQRLDRLDHGIQPPAFDRLVKFPVQTLQPLGLFGDGAHVLLEDDLLRRGRTHHLRQPAQVGGVPAGSALVANVLAQQERFQPPLAPLEVLHGGLAASAQVSQGLVLNPRHVDGAQVAAAHQASQRHRIATIRLHAIARLPRDQRRGDNVAAQALPREVPIQPVATRPGLVDEHQPRTLGLEFPDQRVDVALPRADRPQRHDLRAPLLRRIGDRDRLLVDIETDVHGLARLVHG